jgi:hypothetical protein
MPEHNNGGRTYRVEGSGAIAQALREIQRQAARQGRGEEVLSAFRRIAHQLQRDPVHLGEPLYRLPALRMQIRSVAIRPLVVDFGVCEDRPLVFLRAVKLLSAPES